MTSWFRARRRSIVIAVALGAFVLGAAYLVSKPGSDKPLPTEQGWPELCGDRELRAGRDGGAAGSRDSPWASSRATGSPTSVVSARPTTPGRA